MTRIIKWESPAPLSLSATIRRFGNPIEKIVAWFPDFRTDVIYQDESGNKFFYKVIGTQKPLSLICGKFKLR